MNDNQGKNDDDNDCDEDENKNDNQFSYLSFYFPTFCIIVLIYYFQASQRAAQTCMFWSDLCLLNIATTTSTKLRERERERNDILVPID